MGHALVRGCRLIRCSGIISPISTRYFHSTSSPMLVEAKLTVAGVDINYDKVGHGPCPIICLPGSFGSIETDFGPILSKFSRDEFTVITWDPPGYGNSRPPERDFTGGLEHFKRDGHLAHQLMTELGHEKYSILGWSHGAIPALIMAYAFNTSVQKLVIWGAHAFIYPETMEQYQKMSILEEWSEEMKSPMIRLYGEQQFRQMLISYANLLREIYEKEGPDLFKTNLSKIKCPTLIIHGTKDPLVPFKHTKYLNQNIKNSTLHLMDGGKHNLHLRFPDQFIPLVQQFLLQ